MAVICKHFGVCGGCQTQDVPYPEQLARKRRAVQELLWHPRVFSGRQWNR